MVVAVPLVRVMQVPACEVVEVVAMRDLLMPAAGAVHMAGVVSTAVVLRGARRGVRRVNREHVLIDLARVRVMQVSVVKIVRVTLVNDRGVSALRAVLMLVALVDLMLLFVHGPTIRAGQLR